MPAKQNAPCTQRIRLSSLARVRVWQLNFLLERTEIKKERYHHTPVNKSHNEWYNPKFIEMGTASMYVFMGHDFMKKHYMSRCYKTSPSRVASSLILISSSKVLYSHIHIPTVNVSASIAAFDISFGISNILKTRDIRFKGTHQSWQMIPCNHEKNCIKTPFLHAYFLDLLLSV